MLVNLKMDDATFEAYVNKYGVPNCYTVMKRAIELYQVVDKSDRVIMVAGKERQALEAVFHTTIDDAAKLVKLAQNVTRVGLGDVHMDFNPEELARIAMQAEFHGRTPQQYIVEMVSEIKDRMLEKV